jgi:hypothetical protein
VNVTQLQNVRTKIELHQTCFPNHHVVGWYRVSRGGDETDEDPLPVEEDMVMNHGWMKEFNESPLFVLMDGGAAEKTEARNRNKGGQGRDNDNEEKEEKSSMQLNAGEEAREKMDRDEQLPLTVFETVMTDHGPLFVNLDFELEVSCFTHLLKLIVLLCVCLCAHLTPFGCTWHYTRR